MVTHRGVSKSPETKERRRTPSWKGSQNSKCGENGEKSLMSVTNKGGKEVVPQGSTDKKEDISEGQQIWRMSERKLSFTVQVFNRL